MSKSDSKSDSKLLREVLDQINKKYGAGTLMDLGKEEKIEVETITTGLPSLDFILGGGIPKGRIIEIFGPASSGKTTMSLHILSKCQQEGKRAAFIDVENAFDPTYAQKLNVKVDELLLNQPDSGEEALDIVEKLCQSGQVAVIVIDSVAQLVPMAVQAKEIDGTANVGTTARLLSQTLPRLSNAAARSGTTLIFINQIRMTIGCFQYDSRVTLPSGATIKIGKLVNNADYKKFKIPTLNLKTNKIELNAVKKVFKNGNADSFIQFVIEKPETNGKSSFACTPEHKILTKNGYVMAKDLNVNDAVTTMINEPKISKLQADIILGGLLGDGCIRHLKNKVKFQYRETHCKEQIEYAKWKSEFFGKKTLGKHKKGGIYFETFLSSSLKPFYDSFYRNNKKKTIPKNIKLTPLTLAIWYQDDGYLSNQNKYSITLCTHCFDKQGINNIVKVLKKEFNLNSKIMMGGKYKSEYLLTFGKEETKKFFKVCGKYIHPSMRYKIPQEFKDVLFKFPKPIFESIQVSMLETKILKKYIKPKTKSMVKFDLETKNHNYLIDGVVVHNSYGNPETTPGGMALKFAASIRLEVRGRKAEEREGVEGIPVKITVKKNKIAPPFRQTELFLAFGVGFDELGDLLETAVSLGIIKKSGGWFTYQELQEQGWENIKAKIKADPKLLKAVLTELKAFKK